MDLEGRRCQCEQGREREMNICWIYTHNKRDPRSRWHQRPPVSLTVTAESPLNTTNYPEFLLHPHLEISLAAAESWAPICNLLISSCLSQPELPEIRLVIISSLLLGKWLRPTLLGRHCCVCARAGGVYPLRVYLEEAGKRYSSQNRDTNERENAMYLQEGNH